MARDDGREWATGETARRAEAVQSIRQRLSGIDGFNEAVFDASVKFYEAVTDACPTPDGCMSILVAHKRLLETIEEAQTLRMAKQAVAAAAGGEA